MSDLPEMSDSPGDSLELQAAMRSLPGRRVISESRDELINRLAANLSAIARNRAHEAGGFHLALSGGSSPQALYRQLMVDPAYRSMPWPRTHLWQVDERCVPQDDERSNFRMLRELIIDHCDIPRARIHPMPATEPDGDRRYEQQLREALEPAPHDGRLDFVLLGMGADGHTASLFPETPGLDERQRWVIFNDGRKVVEPRPRITLTYPAINAARHIAILVTGEGKHAALQHAALAAGSGHEQPHCPIAGVAPTHEDTELTWYLDRGAALGPGPDAGD